MKEYGSGYRWTSDGRDAWSRVCRKGSGISMFPLGAPLSQYLPMFSILEALWTLYFGNIYGDFQVWHWSTKWRRAKANRVLPRERTGHSKHPLPTTWEMTLHMNITRWSIQKSDWLYSLQLKMEKLYTVSKNKTTRPGADCGSDHELLISKFRLKLKKAGKTTRPFRYDLN